MVVSLLRRKGRLKTVLKSLLVRVIHRHPLHVCLFHDRGRVHSLTVHHLVLLRLEMGVGLLLCLVRTDRVRVRYFCGALSMSRGVLLLYRRRSGDARRASDTRDAMREDALLAVLAGSEREEAAWDVAGDIRGREVVRWGAAASRVIRVGRWARSVDDSEAVDCRFNCEGRRKVSYLTLKDSR